MSGQAPRTPERGDTSRPTTSAALPLQTRRVSPGRSPGGAPKTPVWREAYDKLISERSIPTNASSGSFPIGTSQTQRDASPSDRVFELMDRNGDGVITRGEWSQALGGRAYQGVGAHVVAPASPSGQRGVDLDMQGDDFSGTRRSQASQSFRLHSTGTHLDTAGSASTSSTMHSIHSPASAARKQAQTDLRKQLAAQRQASEQQVAAVQERVMALSPRQGLPDPADRLQRQVQEMRNQVADTRSELDDQNEQQRVERQDLRAAMDVLKTETSLLQSEQRKQARQFSDYQARKTEGVRDVFAGQEDKLARVEQDVGQIQSLQKTQLQEVAEQGRQITRALEEQAARRSETVSELQQLLRQERGLDASGKLKQELAKHSEAIKEQSGDWASLSGAIQTECSALTGELRVDRDSRALEASSQRYEIARMLEETRLANVASTIGSAIAAAGGDTEMRSKPGEVAVHKIVDTTKALMHNLEEALLIRAGFIAGTFHTWRCEVLLSKTGKEYQDSFEQHRGEWKSHVEAQDESWRQKFEDALCHAAEEHLSHKEMVKRREELLICKWWHGDASGLVQGVLRAWSHYAAHEKRAKRAAATIHLACLQWDEGQTKGLRHMAFIRWLELARQQGAEQRQREDLQSQGERHAAAARQLQEEHDLRIQEGMAKIAQTHKNAKRDLEVIVMKWEMGSKKALQTAAIQAFKENWRASRAGKKQSAAVQQMLSKFLFGNDQGSLKTCFGVWRGEVFASHAILAERKRLEDHLTKAHAEHQGETATRLDAAQRRLDAAHNAVAIIVKKWQLGDSVGILSGVMEVWYRYTAAEKRKGRRLQAVHMQVDKWLEGDKRGQKHACFLNWIHCAKEQALERAHHEALVRERAALEQMLADTHAKHGSELDSLKSEAEKRHDELQAVIQYTIGKWEMGDEKGLLSAVFKNWCTTALDLKQKAVNRSAVHAAMLKSLAGDDRAAIHLSFGHWKTMVVEERKVRDDQGKIEQERAHWEDRERQLLARQQRVLSASDARMAELQAQAYASTEMMLRRWMGADSQGILSGVFTNWRRLCAMKKDLQKRQASVQDSVKRFLLGEMRGVLTSVFTSWRISAEGAKDHRAAIDKLTAQVDALLSKNEQYLGKFALTLGAASGPALLGMLFRAWWEVSQGVQAEEIKREHEVELETLRRAHQIEADRKTNLQTRVLIGMSFKRDRLILMDVFVAWKLEFEQRQQEQQQRLNHNEAMKQFATQRIMKEFTKSSASLLASTFAEWHREGNILRHQEAHANTQRQLEEHAFHAEEMQVQMQALQEDLMMSYKQIDQITHTLQKELQTKEELASELREAYVKLRTNTFPPEFTVSPGGRSIGNPTGSFSESPGSSTRRSHSARRRDRTQQAAQTPVDAVFNALDTNNDGVVSREEWNQAMQQGNNISSPDSPSLGSTRDTIRPRTHSPGKCDWEAAIKKMQADKLLGVGTGK